MDLTGAASRESLDLATRGLDDHVDSAAPADLARMADELFATVTLLDRQASLRRALADPAADPDRRAALLERLIGAQVGDSTLRLLRPLVRSRWSSPRDLVDATELLGRRAALGVAEREGRLDEVEDQLFRFARIANGHPRLTQLLADSTAPYEQRAELADSLLEGHANPVTVRLVTMAVHGLGGRGFDASLQRLVELTAARRDREIAYVTAAALLTPAQEERLTARLAAIYGRAVSLKVEVDPSLLGGVTVRVGDDLYDGSVARRLEQARGALAN
jgi:F-type H+-transporting ATPase subunit delta